MADDNQDAEALAAVLDRVQDGLQDWIAGGIGTLEGRPESWGFVGARAAHALAQIRVARRAAKGRYPTFLECGSGFGFIAALAREAGFTVTGVEVEPRYLEISRRLFPSVRVEEADLLTFDRFGDFDVIYYYGPFADEEVQARFERRVEEALRPGGVILANRKVTFDWRDQGTFALLDTNGSHAFAIQKKRET